MKKFVGYAAAAALATGMLAAPALSADWPMTGNDPSSNDDTVTFESYSSAGPGVYVMEPEVYSYSRPTPGVGIYVGPTAGYDGCTYYYRNGVRYRDCPGFDTGGVSLGFRF